MNKKQIEKLIDKYIDAAQKSKTKRDLDVLKQGLKIALSTYKNK